MNLRRSFFISCLLFSPVLLAAQNANEKPKQQAKELAERAKGEDGDRAKQALDFCTASKLDPKNKKYAEACNSYRTRIIQDDTSKLTSAQDAYKEHNSDQAETLAKQVSVFDEKLSGQARSLIDRIQNERIFTRLKAAWEKGDFAGVNLAARQIGSGDFEADAKKYTENINLYNQYIIQAQKLEKDNPQEAAKQYTIAKELNPNGPYDPAGKIVELQKRIQALNAPPPPAPTPGKTPSELSKELARKVGKLVSDAQNAEKQGNLQDALSDYQTVLKLQPANKDAQSNADRIEQAIKNDPVAAAKSELKSAIRYFYHSQFDDARRVLMNYLETPQFSQNSGAADFYLGATLIERSMLATPRAEWKGPSPEALSAFQAAKRANFKPVRAYVSPTLLKIWDLTNP